MPLYLELLLHFPSLHSDLLLLFFESVASRDQLALHLLDNLLHVRHFSGLGFLLLCVFIPSDDLNVFSLGS